MDSVQNPDRKHSNALSAKSKPSDSNYSARMLGQNIAFIFVTAVDIRVHLHTLAYDNFVDYVSADFAYQKHMLALGCDMLIAFVVLMGMLPLASELLGIIFRLSFTFVLPIVLFLYAFKIYRAFRLPSSEASVKVRVMTDINILLSVFDGINSTFIPQVLASFDEERLTIRGREDHAREIRKQIAARSKIKKLE